jgi:hypothetical protein
MLRQRPSSFEVNPLPAGWDEIISQHHHNATESMMHNKNTTAYYTRHLCLLCTYELTRSNAI